MCLRAAYLKLNFELLYDRDILEIANSPKSPENYCLETGQDLVTLEETEL